MHAFLSWVYWPWVFWWLDLIGLLTSLVASLLILYGTPTVKDIWNNSRITTWDELGMSFNEDGNVPDKVKEAYKRRTKLTKWGIGLLAFGFLLQIPGWYLSKPHT